MTLTPAPHCALMALRHACCPVVSPKSPRLPCARKITVNAVIIRTDAATIRASVCDIPLCLFITGYCGRPYKNVLGAGEKY